ncbi:hypothetical protein [Picosynechococcus sp. NKBG15041c]|uniref:hypothetical protein n=1 Tax=Picosynechococcus sp. NKBG15041c TaxID=1407650 RepID=UPI000467AA4B|nr:hypothetical protein [Picosynechococcus sp. NKBG15041c]
MLNRSITLISSISIALSSCVARVEEGAFREPLQYGVYPSRAVDGDTVVVRDPSDASKTIKLNLCGIKAPGLNEEGGEEARLALVDILMESQPHFIVYVVDRGDFSGNEHDHAEVFYPGEVNGQEADIFVSAEMVRLGHAVVDEQTVDQCFNAYALKELVN